MSTLGDVEILSIDKAIKLFVESINEVMIYSLGKEISSVTSGVNVENKFLLLLTLIEKSAQ